MADKSIQDLNAATNVGSTDLFVLQQTGQAKKLPGQVLENWLLSMADGHGGIHSLVKTSSAGTNPVIDTYTITYADQTTSTFTVTNGLKGDTGSQTYVWIKYADVLSPTDAQIGDSPDDYIGIYVGLDTSAPTTASSYTWFQWKGETGNPSTLIGDPVVTYQASNDGQTIPTGTWYDTPPYVTPGHYLWTKVVVTFNSGNPLTYYTVSRYGVDGQGSAGTATPLADSTSGAVGTSLSFSREDHQHPLPVADDIALESGSSVEDVITELLTFEALHIVGTIDSTQMYLQDSRITADMRVIRSSFGTPSNVTSDLVCTTAAGSITFSGTLSGQTTIDLVLAKTN